MNYIIFDLELNSKPFKNRHPNEIIEIGAVKLDEDLNSLDIFQAFIKPRIYRKLFPIVRRKTGIMQMDLNDAGSFRNVVSDFKKWIDGDYILCSWGHDDIHHLKTNCKLNHMNSGWVKRSMDLQKYFSQIYELPLGQVHSLKNALGMLGIPIEEELHRADADARYTAKVFSRMFKGCDVEKVINKHSLIG